MAQNEGREAVIGIDFRNSADQLFIGLAKNNRGYCELNTYLSQFLTTDQPQIPARAPVFDEAYVKREMNAVHSEHQKNIRNDLWRGMRVLEMHMKKGRSFI